MLFRSKKKLFRDNYLFSREDILKSFEMYIENEKLNEYPKCSPAAHRNRIKLCENFFDTVRKCKLPVLTELWNFYEYRFLVDSITLELCDASEIEIVNDEIGTVTSTLEHTLLNIECEYYTVAQFADIHNVDARVVNNWISRGKLRHADRKSVV